MLRGQRPLWLLLVIHTIERKDEDYSATSDPCLDLGNVGGERSVIDDALHHVWSIVGHPVSQS